MRYGFVQPFLDARFTVELAVLAEQAGWDGFFVWEPVWGIEAWVQLGAAAVLTQRIRLGTMISPVSRMRPWKLASETATLDNLSGGRVLLSVGLGAPDVGFAEFGEVTDRKTRAELLDEGLEIMTGLWRGQPFSFEGKHYHIRPTTFNPPPPPVQQPRIPIWIGGDSPAAYRRAAQWDGWIIGTVDEAQNITLPPAQLAERVQTIRSHRPGDTPFDVAVDGCTRPDGGALVAEYAAAGATWWFEAIFGTRGSHEELLARIKAGPPR